MSSELRRTLRTPDAVVVGLGSMIGAGIFVAFAPAAAAAGSYVMVALALAAVVAWCNAMSSARLAALYPESGGTYVYGRERLGPLWGYVAGWSFIVGKTASCAAMALTVGYYLWPAQARWVAIAAVLLTVGANYFGITKSARLSRWIVAIVLLGLAIVIVSAWFSPVTFAARAAQAGTLGLPVTLNSTVSVEPGFSAGGILQGAAILFFAFAGYARIATLGEEVIKPARTIPRAIGVALAITVSVYALVGLVLLRVLGAAELGAAIAPLTDAAVLIGVPGAVLWVPLVAALSAFGALLGLVLGVSRTVFAMARDGHLPQTLHRIHPKYRVPHRADLLIGLVCCLVVAVADVRGAIGFSSFGVLVYYLIANASAFTLPGRRWVAIVGGVGCVALAFSLPLPAVIGGLGVLAAGVGAYLLRGKFRRPQ